MKKTKGNWKVYFWSPWRSRWELSGNTGLYAQRFVSQEKAEAAIRKYGAGEVRYKAATSKPKRAPNKYAPIVVR